MTPAPLPDPLQEQWPGAVVASGSTAFFTFVALSSAEAVRAYVPDLAAIAAVGSKALLLTAAAAPGSGADYVLRVFGPNVGIDEDPATGSAQCSAGPYWAAELGRDDPRRPPALPARRRAVRASRRATGCASPGTRPRCSPATCARDSRDGESDAWAPPPRTCEPWSRATSPRRRVRWRPGGASCPSSAA